MNVRVRFLGFVPRDAWVGVYVEPPRWDDLVQRTYICLLPCLPILIERRIDPLAGVR